MKSKVMSMDEALSHVKSGNRIMVGGFGEAGVPIALLGALSETDRKDLTLIGNDIASPRVPGVVKLFEKNMVKKLLAAYPSRNTSAVDAILRGDTEITFIPQGTLAERIRAAAAGLGGVLTPTGVGTDVEAFEGGKTRMTLHGKDYLLEEALSADVAFIFSNKADERGNLFLHGASRNFNVAMAGAAKYVIAQTYEVVKAGEIDPDLVTIPGVFVDAVVHCVRPEGL